MAITNRILSPWRSTIRWWWLGLALLLCSLNSQAQSLNELTQQAGQGDANAQLELAKRYFNGIGLPRDYRQAFAWLKLSAAQGQIDAQYYLGWMYAHGKGFEKDPKQAFYWVQLAAQQNDGQAQYLLAQFYDSGFGVEQSAIQAHAWYQKACTHRVHLACLKVKSKPHVLD